MAAQPNTTRRALFAMALPLGASLGLAASAAPSGSIAEIWGHAKAREDRINAHFFGNDEDAVYAETEEIDDLIVAVLLGPIRGRADAFAKLRASAGLTLERGDRHDGLDEPAFEDAMRWLEAH